jgi:replicative DNA helicase
LRQDYSNWRCSEEYPSDLAATIVVNLAKRERARQVMEQAVEILNGNPDANFEQIGKIISEAPSDGTVGNFRTVDTALAALLKANSCVTSLSFRFAGLRKVVPGVGPGNLGIVFGRPEVGKTSLVSDIVVGYAEQGKKGLYFGNEEPGHKLGLSFARAKLAKSDTELSGLSEKECLEWERVRPYIELVDAVGVSVDEADAYVAQKNPAWVVFDQADKLRIGKNYTNGHERLKDIYIATREIAKRRGCAVWDVSQASADAEGKRVLTFDMLDMSKTGKAGEADIIIGIGKDPDVEDNGMRYLTISKNKINGFKNTIACKLDTLRCQFKE